MISVQDPFLLNTSLLNSGVKVTDSAGFVGGYRYTPSQNALKFMFEQTLIAPEFGSEGCSFPLVFSSNAPAFCVAMHVEKTTHNSESTAELASIPFRLLDEPELAEAVSKLWAAQRFEYLMDQACLKPGELDDAPTELAATELAVRFGLVTPLTSACLT